VWSLGGLKTTPQLAPGEHRTVGGSYLVGAGVGGGGGDRDPRANSLRRVAATRERVVLSLVEEEEE
jgi:hypothetical protein